MTDTSNGTSRFRFGQFEADISEGKLLRRGVQVRLEHQPFQILAVLLDHPGETVGREELCSILWPEGTYVDFDEGLNTAVKKLRSALDDAADNPTFIETVPRRGYCFIAPVRGGPPSLVETDATAATLTRPWFSERTITLAAIVLAFLVGLAILGIVRGRAHAPQEPVFSKVSFGRGTVTSARFAPDGQTVYYGAAWDGKPVQLFSTPVSGSVPRSLDVEGDILSISRENKLAVLLDVHAPWYPERSGTLAVVPNMASSPRKLLDDVQDADWSPDGTTLLVAHWVRRHCRLEFPIGKVIYEKEGVWVSSPRISPRGDRIAFVQHPLRHDDAGLAMVVDLDGTTQFASQMFPGIQGLAWDPSGESVWFTADEAGSRGGRAIFQARVGDQPRLIRRESSALTLGDISADGRVLVARESLKARVVGRISQAVHERDLGWLDVAMPTDLSANGGELLLSVQREAAGQGYLVYVRHTHSDSPPTLLGEGFGLKISPDGKSVVGRYPAVSRPPAISQFIILTTGAGQPRPLTHDSINHAHATWLPDNRHLAFTGNEPGRARRTWLQDLNGDPAVPLTPEGTEGEWISRDGRLLAATDTEQNIWIYPLDGGKPYRVSKLEQDEEILNWSADGRGLFISNYASPADVSRIELATGQRKLLFQLAPADTDGVMAVGPVLITPDAKSYVYNYSRILSDLYVATGLR